MYIKNNHFLKLISIFVVLLLNIANANAQLSMQFNAVNEYVFSSKEALNFTAINSNAKPFEAVFTGTIKKGNGELVCDFKTNPVWLQAGANVFTSFSLSMADINYHDNDILEIETKSGQYPSGNYTICVMGHCATADCNGLGANAASMETPICISIQTENPTPLILVTPENESEIEETRPLFSWIPPSPVAGSANLNYTLILVEMLDGQNKADALNQNRPLIEMEGIGNPALLFPSDIPELEKGKWYAWQVQAYVGKTPIAKSEQWKFKVKKKEEKKEVYRYYDLNKITSDIPKVKLGDKLFFTIQNQLSTNQPQFILKEMNGNSLKLDLERVVKDSIDAKQDIYTNELANSGISKYLLTLNSMPFITNKIYELSIQYNNQKTIFRFEIIE